MYTRPWMGHEGHLLHGPLLKSYLTIELEKIIALIALNYSSASISFSKTSKYTLQLTDKSYDLSFSITFANLNQLELSNDLLDQLEVILNQSTLKNVAIPDGDQVLSLLKPIQRQVLHYYTDDYYEDIGKLFRGEKIDDMSDVLNTFLIGCILSHTANQLPLLLHDERVYTKEKSILAKIQRAAVSDFSNNNNSRLEFIEDLKSKALYKSELNAAKKRKIISVAECNFIILRYKELRPLLSGYGRLYRAEKLEKNTALKRKRATALPLPSITSCAYDKNVWTGTHYSYFSRYRLPRLKSVSMHDHEKEVLLPAGVMIAYKSVPERQDKFKAEIVSGLQFSERYWPMHAFYYVADNILNSKFEDESDATLIGKYTVERPNHGAPHTYDTMKRLSSVIDYFMNYAKDKKFAKFCKKMDFYLFDWLQIAVAFSVTGRKSEISFGDNPDLYFTYRLNSQSQFRKYNKENHPVNYDPQRDLNVNRIEELILYMGNPKYRSIIKNKYDPDELKTRLFLHRIISLAHKLDLPRCYSYDQYLKSLSEFKHYVGKSKKQRRSWNKLMRSAVAAIESRGDELYFALSRKGAYVPVTQDYQADFGKYSVKPREFVQFRENHEVIDCNSEYHKVEDESFEGVLLSLPAMSHHDRLDAILKRQENGKNLLHYAASSLPTFRMVYQYIKSYNWLDSMMESSSYIGSPMQIAARHPDVLKFVLVHMVDASRLNNLLSSTYYPGNFLLEQTAHIPDSFSVLIGYYSGATLLNHLTLVPVLSTKKCILSSLVYYPASLEAVLERIGFTSVYNLCLFRGRLMPDSLISMTVSLPESLNIILSNIPAHKKSLMWQDIDGRGYSLFHRSFYDVSKQRTYSNPAGLALLLKCVPQSQLESILIKEEINGVSNLQIIAHEPLNLRTLIKNCPRSVLLSVFGISHNQSLFESLYSMFWYSRNKTPIMPQLVDEFLNYETNDYEQLQSLSESILYIFEFLDKEQRNKFALATFGPRKHSLVYIVDCHFNLTQKYRFKKMLPPALQAMIHLKDASNEVYFGRHPDMFMDVDEQDVAQYAKKMKH